MCFGSKDNPHNDHEAPRPAQHPSSQQTYAPDPKSGHNNTNNKNNNATMDYQPPPGPPPSVSRPAAPSSGPPRAEMGREDFAPPPGPPPGFSSAKKDDDYAPPPGPPPGSSSRDDEYAPPPGPPPPQKEEGRKLQDWELAVPDTSLFPPPPDIFSGWDRSAVSNAPEEDANAGEAWCAQHKLAIPVPLPPQALAALAAHSVRLMPPQGYHGKAVPTDGSGRSWKVQSQRNARDTCIIAYPPLYSVRAHSPLASGRPKTIYYEARVLSAPGDEASIALGFSALPYPPFRMPGWHRASLAVHGDDGSRFVNDRWGGKSFTKPFRKGQTVGLGMTLKPDGQGRIGVNVFFTRDGRLDGQWDLHEETDADQDLPVTGLEGFHDLACSLGTFGGVTCDVIFEPSMWAYKKVTDV